MIGEGVGEREKGRVGANYVQCMCFDRQNYKFTKKKVGLKPRLIGAKNMQVIVHVISKEKTFALCPLN